MKEKGFTLVELLVALMLAMILSSSIFLVANQTQQIYAKTSAQVELFSRIRYSYSRMKDELARMVATSDLEYFIDNKASTMKSNSHWDQGEAVRSVLNLAGGWAPQGKAETFYNEAPQIVERYYTRKTNRGGEKKHPAFEIYFRAPVRVGGKLRFANIEYRLVKARDLEKLLRERKEGTALSYSRSQLPPVEEAEPDERLSLIRVVRYLKKGIEIFERPQWTRLMRCHISVLCFNLHSFKIEYFVRNKYGAGGAGRGVKKAGWYVPSEDYGKNAVELSSVGVEVPDPSEDLDSEEPGVQGGVYVKEFAYGTSRLQNPWPSQSGKPPRGIIRKAIKIDPRRPQGNAQPPEFYVSGLKFSELGVGDKIYIWRDVDPVQPFYGGEFTIRNIVNGHLIFEEPIETAGWKQDKSGLRFKAAYLPVALRLTIVITDREGIRTNTLQRIVRMATKTNS